MFKDKLYIEKLFTKMGQFTKGRCWEGLDMERET